jgi:hypothetical protein
MTAIVASKPAAHRLGGARRRASAYRAGSPKLFIKPYQNSMAS